MSAEVHTAFDEPPQPHSASDHTAKVLILDDEPFILALMGELLELLGYACQPCSAPSEALELLKNGDFDVVLSDFRMPGMNGEQFYEAALRIRPEFRNRIIFLTGDTLHEETQEFLKRVGAPHLSKPFHLENVEKTIAEVLALTA
jgi:CheY-like chemotaxis protein